jgi:DNA-binding CsgD family transcriptional regulator
VARKYLPRGSAIGLVMSMVIHTDRDLDSGVTTVWLDGDLTWSTVSAVRLALAKCVVECPVAVIVELSGLRADRPGVLSVFPTAARRAARDQGVPVLLCAPGRDIAGPLAASRMFAQVYTGHGDALAAVRDARPRWVHARMAPTPVSASLARVLVGDACLAWDVPHLHYQARTVVSELASNAIEHTAGDFEVTAAQVGIYLRIGVQDHSLVAPRLMTGAPPDPQAPLADRGRGLSIVQFLATHWGATPLDNGKIVWALLRAHPTSATDPDVRHNRVAAHGSMPPAATATQPTSPSQRSAAGRTGIRTARNRFGMSAVPESPGVFSIRPERLTEREVDIVRYLPTVLTVGEIATELYLSVDTVKAHLKSIYRKLDASRRRQAVDRAYELGVITRATPADGGPRG